MEELTQEVLNIINETIEGKYIGELSINYDDGSYMLKMYLNRDRNPLILSYEGSENDFKKFIKSEIEKRKLETIDYWKIKREIYNNDCE